MAGAPQPRMHGLTHTLGGADPIPGLGTGGGALEWDDVGTTSGPTELAYAQITAGVSLVLGSTTTIVTAPTITLLSSQRIRVEFYSSGVECGPGAETFISLWDSSTDLATPALVHSTAAGDALTVPCKTETYLTAAAGPHTYMFRGSATGSAGFVHAGPNGPNGISPPAFIRVSTA